MGFTTDVPAVAAYLVAFVFGAVWGSFFNVAIYRWPRELSVVHPPSHCPACQKPIPPHRNVPLLGYLLLRGRAACCGARLSPRYFLVELTSALLLVAIVHRVVIAAPAETALAGAILEAALLFAFAGGLIIATFVDLEWMEIPDEVTLPGAALGLATVTLRGAPGAADAALGAGVGFLIVQLLFVWGYERLTGRRGMGEGDAKLLLFIGAFTGLGGSLFALVAGSVQGLLIAGAWLLLGKRTTPTPPVALAGTAERGADEPDDEPPPAHAGHLKVPFGPFLALAALEYFFFGDELVAALFLPLGE